MPPTDLTDATLDAAQALGNRFTQALASVHDDDEVTLKADVKNLLCELQELCLGQPLARQNMIREDFINEILANLANVG